MVASAHGWIVVGGSVGVLHSGPGSGHLLTMSAVGNPRIDFGYHPPAGDRGIERVSPQTFLADLERVLTRVAPSFESLWISDHFMTNDRFRLECWTLLTWIAARFPGPLVGTIVMANSYRHPPLLAKAAASLQALSGGRLVLGYGAGWVAEEYRGYGYSFPPLGRRIDEMVEAIKIIRLLWTGGPVSFSGHFYAIEEALCIPAPSPPPPVMIGGDGERYTLRAVAEHADWWNTLHRPLDLLRRRVRLLDEHCATVGREPASLRRTIVLTVFLRADADEARQLAGSRVGGDNPAFAGDPSMLREHLAQLAALGFDHMQLVFPDFPDLGDVELFLAEVRPAFA
jgi:alkanesulfonate monooxygenase SsuD/methylene tetrahydromethanopterin reductase-like flavin-dependent oxidoreductase (luciferase family)